MRARHCVERVRGFSVVGGLALLGALTPSLATTTIAGFTPGAFSVSPTGAATYTIPIQIPPGIAGMEPKLSLVYNSQGGNSMVGVGWSLAGLSAISRCGRTLVQDGVNTGVQYSGSGTTGDRYCLDGQRLVAMSGTYGANGTVYLVALDG